MGHWRAGDGLALKGLDGAWNGRPDGIRLEMGMGH